jgi:hypothetical protein
MSISRLLLRGVQALIVTLVLLYAVDWTVLHVRASHGTAYQTIQVHQFLSTPLKGQKEEYDYTGDVAEACSNSIFPQAGNPPCWWLTRHTSEWQ